MIVSVRTYCWVAVALMVLLAAAVAVSFAPLGPWRLAVSLAIAGVKAALVALFFMHVRYGFPLMRLFAVAGLLWLTILIGLTLSDYISRPNWPPPLRGQPQPGFSPAGQPGSPMSDESGPVSTPSRARPVPPLHCVVHRAGHFVRAPAFLLPIHSDG